MVSYMRSKTKPTVTQSSETHDVSEVSWEITSELKDRPVKHQEASVVVVIPFYNGSTFIERAVQSVLEQTVPPKEFVVVDDGSSDEEAAKLDIISKRMGFRVLRKKNGGQGSARNAGVAATNSDFICFLDQDDFYLKNHIEILLDAKPENDPHFGWVYGDLFEADGNGNIVRTSIVIHHSQHPKKYIVDLLAGDMFVLPSASLIARNAYVSVGGFDEQFMGYEDDDLFLRLFRAGFTNYFTEKAVTVWCIHTESTSYGIRMARSRLAYFKKLVKNFPDDTIKERFFIRDLIIPRFHKSITQEAVAANSKNENRFTKNKKEYTKLVHEYLDVVLSIDSCSLEFKNMLKEQVGDLSSGLLIVPEHPNSSSNSGPAEDSTMGALLEDLDALRESGDFDESWYQNEYPDVAMSGLDPAHHYLWIGRRLGRKSKAT